MAPPSRRGQGVGAGAVHDPVDEAALGCCEAAAPDTALQQVDLEPGVALPVVGMLAEPAREESNVGLLPLLGSEDVTDPCAQAVMEVERGPVVSEGGWCRPPACTKSPSACSSGRPAGSNARSMTGLATRPGMEVEPMCSISHT